MNLLFTVAAFLVALGVLIVFHELGHYCAARIFGVKVLRFSIGFGKPLVSWHAGADRTEWAIAAFPFGGYVKMLDEREGQVAPGELARAFNRQPLHQRFFIVAAGPLANFFLAVILYWALFVHGVPGIKPVLGPVPPATAAAQAGFTAGDTIVAVGGKSVITWQDVRWALLESAVGKKRTDVEVRTRQGKAAMRRLDLSAVSPDDLEGGFLKNLGLTAEEPPLKPVIGKVVENGPAGEAGLRAGDVITAIDGRPVSAWSDVVEAVRRAPGRKIVLTVRRSSAELSFPMRTQSVEEDGKKVGKIGIAPKPDPDAWRSLAVESRYPPGIALIKAMDKTWETSALTLRMLGKMVIGEASLKNVSGPITIADYAGQSAQLGLIAYVSFLALISVSLGILNLLPIPVLDGGHLMYYIVELAKGSPVSEKAMEIGQQVGMALLFVLMAFALYNDINRLLSG